MEHLRVSLKAGQWFFGRNEICTYTVEGLKSCTLKGDMYINATQIPDPVHRSHYNKCTCTTTVKPEEVVEVEAFFYIVIVIAFYSITIVFLLIKYNRNDDEEQASKYNYSEYVNRERFQTARYKNRMAVERTKALLGSLNLVENIKVAAGTVCPVIIVSEYQDDVEKDDTYQELDYRKVETDSGSSKTSRASSEDCDDVMPDVEWTSVYFDAVFEYRDCNGRYKPNSDRRRSCHSI